jgi:hypothetical protein
VVIRLDNWIVPAAVVIGVLVLPWDAWCVAGSLPSRTIPPARVTAGQPPSRDAGRPLIAARKETNRQAGLSGSLLV